MSRGDFLDIKRLCLTAAWGVSVYPYIRRSLHP